MNSRPAESEAGFRGLVDSFAFLGLLLALASPALAKDYETVTFKPPHLNGAQVSFNIILPRDYANSSRRYPVLYLLHGYTGHFSDWVTHTGITQYARNYREIIVMPEGENSWYVNDYANPKMKWQSYLIDEECPYFIFLNTGMLRCAPDGADHLWVEVPPR